MYYWHPFDSITEYYTRKWPFDLCGKPYSYLMTVNYDNIPIGYAYPEYINALFLSYLVNFASEKIDMKSRMSLLLFLLSFQPFNFTLPFKQLDWQG